MNKIFLLTCWLRKPITSYCNFYDAIRDSAIDTNQLFEDAWILKVDNTITADDLCKKFKPFMTDNDCMFIIDITNQDKNGRLALSFWKWLKKDENGEESKN